MKSENEMKLVFLSKSSNEAFARVAVSAFVSQKDPTVEELSDIKTAVSEAVTNCIVHAYPDSIGKIELKATLFDNNTVKIRIRDRGVGIDDVSLAMQPLYTTGGEERSGLGFSVMESFCDDVRVVSKTGRGTGVTLIKKLSQRVKNG
ncbi:MAG: anti-sigma F factor [Acutalibacteraceae bacterium]